MGGETLGTFEHQVLVAMMRLGDETYSVPIVRELERLTGRRIAPAAVYVTLRRLEDRGLVASRKVPPPPGEPGRARRFFSVGPEAVALVRSMREELSRLWDGIEALEM